MAEKTVGSVTEAVQSLTSAAASIAACPRCGSPVAPASHLAEVQAALGRAGFHDVDYVRMCDACKEVGQPSRTATVRTPRTRPAPRDPEAGNGKRLPLPLYEAHGPTEACGLADRTGAGTDRRRFLKQALTAAGGAAAFMSALPSAAAAISRDPATKVLGEPGVFVEGNILERMMEDLERALAKPMEQRKWVMVIDLQKCINCKACTVSCNAENNLPPGVVYRPVVEEEVGEFPDVRKRFIPRPCMQCDNPPCTPVCPVNATWKRPDGIVEIDYDACIGCRYCITACPYNARTSDFGEYYGEGLAEGSEAMVGEDAMAYETRPNFEYGRTWQRRVGSEASPKGNARKCQFCLHRLENHMLPACVTTCLGGATYFGDYNDERSLVHELVGSSRMMRLKEELGTEPKVFYLV